MNGYLTVISVLLLLLAAAAISWRRADENVKQLDKLLTDAMDGRLPQEPSEQAASLERRLREYLAYNGQSARTVQAQTEQIGALVTDISNQAQEPIGELQRYVKQLFQQPLTPEEQACAQGIAAQADRLQALVEAMVKTSRLETGEISLHTQADELAPMVSRAAARYAPKAWDKEVTLTTGDDQGRAVFDAKWTEEALCCLLDNAVKYTSSGGSIRVEVRNEEKFSVIQVSDTGPGIPEQDQARIFGRFCSIPQKDQPKGVGMGLYFARQVAEGQGGYIKVESILGKGSTFSLYLPQEKKKKPAKRPGGAGR